MLQLVEHQRGYPAGAVAAQMTQPLTNEDQAETVNFLSRRPQQTFLMSGWIHDNGIESSLNRGSFYSHRNVWGQLEGVALIGHVTLFETVAGAALAAFAGLAQSCPSSHTLVGEQDSIKDFLHYYGGNQRPSPPMDYREMFVKHQFQPQFDESVPGLGLVSPDVVEME